MNDVLLNTWASRLLLPLLLVNVTVANQEWRVGPLMISQVLFFWPAIICAFLIVVLRWGASSVWPLLLLGGVAAARAVGANNAAGSTYFLYGLPLHTLFFLAGGVLAMRRRERLYRQLRVYFLLTVPFMFLQVAGAGDWTLALNTETTAVGDSDVSVARSTRRLLFVAPDPDVPLTIGQSRPSGLMHANNVLSLVILLALAIALGRLRRSPAGWSDALFVAAMVLAMAKIVMLGFVLMAAALVVIGSRYERRRVRRILVLTAALYGVYALLFPLLFFHHFNLYHVMYSFSIRINDFLGTLDPNSPLVEFLAPHMEDTPELIADEGTARLSGYAMLSGILPYLMVVAAIGSILYLRALAKVRRWSPEAATTSVLVLLIAVLFPAAVPYWRSPLYWFILGIGMMPMIWCYLSRGAPAPTVLVRPSEPGFQNQ